MEEAKSDFEEFLKQYREFVQRTNDQQTDLWETQLLKPMVDVTVYVSSILF